jgi:O-antigen/teichoic acid export membrane protein
MHEPDTVKLSARWLGRAGSGIADQALIAGTNFALNILFARWMSVEAYGVFAVTMSCILIITGFQVSLVLDPMTLFGAGKYRPAARAYVRKLGAWHLLACAMVGALVLLLAAFGGLIASPAIEFAFAAALCATVLFAFVRRAIYLQIRPHVALAAAAVQAVTSIGLTLVWYRLAEFSPAHALLVIAAGASAGSVAGWGLSRPRPANTAAETPPPIRMIAEDHWHYGRWAGGTSLVYIGGVFAYPPLIAWMVGLDAAGRFRGVETLFMPVAQLTTALGMVGLPVIVAQRDRLGPALVRSLLLGSAALTVPYAILVVVFAPAIAGYVFANPDYGSDLWLTAAIGTATVMATVQNTAVILLRAIDGPRGEFWSQLAVTAITLTIGIGAGLLAGLDGLVTALVGARTAGLAVALWLLTASMQQRRNAS